MTEVSVLTISRALARQVRAVFKRTFSGPPRSAVWVRLLAAADGLRIQAPTEQVAIEFHLTGAFEPGEWLVPLELLAACEGKSSDPVQLATDAAGHVVAEWLENGIPQRYAAAQPPENLAGFPPRPVASVSNSPELLSALVEAGKTTDAQSSRFALDCLSLRGESGNIVATDGRQLLAQSGWQFPWSGDVLVRANRVFSSPELPKDQPVQVGQVDDWVTFAIGGWSIYLRTPEDARFPKVDDLVRNVEMARSRLTISAGDARFAIDALKRLPVGDDDSKGITLDLNGEVLLRARSAITEPATELHLVNSQLTGESVRLVSAREFLRRALSLGFTEFSLFGSNTTLQAGDARRDYIWMPWAEACAVPADVDTRRITSPTATHSSRKRNARPAAEPIQVSAAAAVQTNSVPEPVETMPETKPMPSATASPIEQVCDLRDVLSDVLAKTNQLLRSLKLQRKQSRRVETTLQSLKQLQQVA